MASKISVCLEIGFQAAGALVPDCPGRWVFGQTKKRALEKVKVSIAEWLDWLREYGESAPDVSNREQIKVAEMLCVN